MRRRSPSIRASAIVAVALFQVACGELLCPECDDLSQEVAANDGAPKPRENPFSAVGAFPNLPAVTVDTFVELRKKMFDEARFTGIPLPLLWKENYYSSNNSCDPKVDSCKTPTCEIGQCPPCTNQGPCYWKPSDSPDCRAQGFDELECFVANYAAVWLQSGGLESGGTVLFSIYGRVPPETWRFGPDFVRALQSSPSDLNSDATWGYFSQLYDRLNELLVRHVGKTGMSWIIGLEGAPLGCADHGADDDYALFFKRARDHIRSMHQGPGPAPLVVSPTPFIAEECDGIWDLDQKSLSAREPVLKGLNELSDAVAFRYHPMDYRSGWLALNPDRAADDMAQMIAFRDRLAPLHAGAPERPIIITTVGYSSDPGLHNQRPSDRRYSSFVDGELAQAELVKNLFAFSRGHRRAHPQTSFSLFWGPLLDIGDADTEVCFQRASLIGKTDLPTRRAYCSSGLLHPLGGAALDKPAWSALLEELSTSEPE